MAMLGIITCEILELEFAHLLSTDPEVTEVTVIEDMTSLGFIEALESFGRLTPRRIPILRGEHSPCVEGVQVLVRVLELGLHNRKSILQEGLIKAVKEMGRHVEGIVLGYGLCGNALQNPQELLSDAGVPLFIPMDEDHPVDDCVGLILGGRETYYGEQCKEAGTFFMIPGWSKHWKRQFIDNTYRDFPPKMLKLIFSAYKRSLLVTIPVLSEEKMRQNIEEFNKMFGFRTEVRQGTLDILYTTWEHAKRQIGEVLDCSED